MLSDELWVAGGSGGYCWHRPA